MKYLYSLPVPFSGKRVSISVDMLQTDGGKNFLYETATVKNAVAVLPIMDNGDLVLLKNYRHPIKDSILEVPAGLIDDIDRLGSDKIEIELKAAQRELKEETGYTADEWSCAGEFYTSPGWTTEKVTLFVAKKLKAGVQELEETEKDIIVVNTKLDKALFMIKHGAIKDMKTALLIQHYAAMKK